MFWRQKNTEPRTREPASKYVRRNRHRMRRSALEQARRGREGICSQPSSRRRGAPVGISQGHRQADRLMEESRAGSDGSLNEPALGSTTAIRVLPSPDAIGEDLATRILARIDDSREQGKSFLLGCPTGRTPRPIYAAMARRLAETRQELNHLVLVMMDEYLVPAGARFGYASANEPWSCHHFARAEIVERFNAPLPPSRRIPEDSVWFPDP